VKARMIHLISACLLFAAPGLSAQCTRPPHPAFEFEVDQPAAYIGDSTMVPRPAAQAYVDARMHPEVLVVQFVVDTLGVPDTLSFRTLRTPSRAALDSVRQTMPSWRFSPAIQQGCKVPQLVQTAVSH
jgi:hypothetical protein